MSGQTIEKRMHDMLVDMKADQKIRVEALLRLTERNKEVSTAIANLSESIESLCARIEKMETRIKRLEN